MPQRITEELVRKRAEHNNLEITTLEEISLHQLDIEKIEHLDRWCRDLKILYLQSNLISKIENVGRLKKLEYLNLALNSVSTIESLEGCESLEKLDLTVNFVGDLLSVEKLRENYHLREIFLTGNPCTEFEGYRDFVVATLPRLKWLDGKEIVASERIQASQKLDGLRERILQQQLQYFKKREAEKEERIARKRAKAEKKKAKNQPGFDGRWYTDIQPTERDSQAPSGKDGDHLTDGTAATTEGSDDNSSSDDDELEGYTPESRLETHLYMEKKRKDPAKKEDTQEVKKPRSFFKEGRPLNINDGRYDFTLSEDEANNQYTLDLSVPRFMDSSLLEADVQPLYVRVLIKGKILQLALQEEVSPDSSTAKRSQTTGHLVVTMPKVSAIVKAKSTTRSSSTAVPRKSSSSGQSSSPQTNQSNSQAKQNSRQLLEVDPSVKTSVDLSNIAKENGKKTAKARCPRSGGCGGLVTNTAADPAPPLSEGFVDNPDVPPLM